MTGAWSLGLALLSILQSALLAMSLWILSDLRDRISRLERLHMTERGTK